MDLKSLFKRLSPRASAASDDAVQQARTRARRRLVGAAVLLVVGVITFPLLFETKPRPLPMDTPMAMAQKAAAGESVAPALPSNAASMPMPASSVAGTSSTSGTSGTSASSPAVGVPAAAVTAAVATAAVATAVATAGSGDKAAPPVKSPASAPTSAPTSAPASVAASAPGALKPAASQPAAQASAKTPAKAPATTPAKTSAKTPAKPEPKVEKKADPKAEAKAETKAGRFTVQVGAFADAAATREARSKAEKLGLKTYTQEVDTSAGKRTRVRVGPFKTREEAQQAAAKLRAANLPASVLTL